MPDAWCIETFGALPTSAAAFADEATTAGWTVLESEHSTLDEWDTFEEGLDLRGPLGRNR